MKKFIKIATVLISVVLLHPVMAGNPDRSGQSGASELLINPFARSSGWAGANVANARGLESQFLNVAGLAFTERTEVVLVRTDWLRGADVHINTFGLVQKVGDAGALGLGVMSMSFGDIPITTVDHPDASGEIGRFSPSYLNVSLSYAKAFSHAIYGGINLRVISQSIPDAAAQGIAIDAGIQYVTGIRDQIKFGISLKNVGPRMRYSGDGMSFQGRPRGAPEEMTVQQRSAEFELPSLLNIGGAYDFILVEDRHTLTVAANFTSNSFTKDRFLLGVEYGLKDYLLLRAGYAYEDGLFDDAERTTALTGPAGGLSVQIPLSPETSSIMSLDYSYRTSNPFMGVHSIGVRVDL